MSPSYVAFYIAFCIAFLLSVCCPKIPRPPTAYVGFCSVSARFLLGFCSVPDYDITMSSTCLNQADFDAEGFEFGHHTDGNSVVGNDGVELGGIGNMNETALVELR